MVTSWWAWEHSEGRKEDQEFKPILSYTAKQYSVGRAAQEAMWLEESESRAIGTG